MGNMSREDAETHLQRNADQMVFLVRESKGRLCLTIRQKNNLGCAHSFIERGRNLYWTMRNGVKISAPTLFQLMVQLGLPLPAQPMGGMADGGQEMYQSVPDAGAITGGGPPMGMGMSMGMGGPPMGNSLGMANMPMGNSGMTPGFMPNSLGRPPMPSSSPMNPNASRFPMQQQQQMQMPVQQQQQMPNNKAMYAPAGLAARGVSSPYDDQGQNWSNNNNNDNNMGGGGGNNNGGGSARDNVHLIDERDVQLMKVNGMPERIGEGAYGVVYRGEWTFDKESADLVDPWLERRSNRIVTVAVKQLGGSSPDKEIAVWTTLRHPNIVPLFGLVDSLKEKLVMPCCVPEEHEILTSRGFMHLDAYVAAVAADATLLVAGYDAASKTLLFERPHRLVELPRETRTLVELSGSADVGLLVTQDHDLYVAHAAAAKFAKVKAADVLHSDNDAVTQLAVAENGVGERAAPCAVFDELALRTPARVGAFCELLGFWLGAAGSLSSARLVRFTQLAAADVAWLKQTLSVLELEHDVNDDELVVNDATLAHIFTRESKSNKRKLSAEHDDAKSFPSWAWQLGSDELRSILSGLSHHHEQQVIYTSSTRFRDELVRVCLMAGYSPHFGARSEAEQQWAVWYEAACMPTLSKARGEVREREHTGRVWCFTMPSGMIWARRAERDGDGVVREASRPLLTGNCNGASLRRRLTDLPQECSERPFQLRVLRDVAAGVAYLHEKEIVHRDLAARNVLLHRFRGTSPDQEVALLADFGLTRKIDAKAQYNAANFNVPLQPLAPEQLLDYHNGRAGCRSTPQSDVWAFGVLCAEMLLPHVDQFYAEVTANCGSNTGSWIESVYQYVTVDCRTPLDDFNLNEATVDVVAVAKRCMQHNETTRPLMKDIYRQLREQCEQPEPKTVGDVPKALYGSSELDIVVREAIEGERQFARRLDVLFNVFEKELQASTMSDVPAMTIADIKIVFRNSGALYNAANTLQQTLATCDRANFGQTMLDALKKTKFDKVMTEYLKGVLPAQGLLYELMYPKQRANKKRAEALQLFLDQRSASRKAKGLNLPDLLSSPYAHLTEMKRMLARIGTHTDSKTDKAALDESLKLLDSIALDGEREVTEGQAKEIVQGLAWRKLPGDQYPLDANAKRNLLRMGELGVCTPGSRKPKSRTVYLFDDAIVVCDKKNAVALLELLESTVECTSLGPSAFQVTARAIRDARMNILEFVCEARRDALHWVDDIDYVVKNKKTKGSAAASKPRDDKPKDDVKPPRDEPKPREERAVSPPMDRSRSGRMDNNNNNNDRMDRMDRSNNMNMGGGGGMGMSGMGSGMGGGGGMDRSMRGNQNQGQMMDNNFYGDPQPQQYWDQSQQQQQPQQQDWNRSGRTGRDPAYDQMRIANGQSQSGWDDQSQMGGQMNPGYTRGQPGGAFANSGFQPPPASNSRAYDYDERQNMNSSSPNNNRMAGSRPMGGVPMGSMGMAPGSMQIQPPPMGGMPPPPMMSGMGVPPPPMMGGGGNMPMSAMGMPPPMMGSRPMQNSMGLPPMQTANTMQMGGSMGVPPPQQQQQMQRQGSQMGGNGRMRSRTDAMPAGPPMLNMMMSAPVRARSPSPRGAGRQMPNSMGLPSRGPSMSNGWDQEDNMTEYEDYDDEQNNYVALPDARGGGGGGMGGGGMGGGMGGSMPMRDNNQQESYVALPLDQRSAGGGVISAIQGAVQQSRQRGY